LCVFLSFEFGCNWSSNQKEETINTDFPLVSNCVLLNDSAMVLYTEHNPKYNPFLLNTCLDLLDSAIKCDPDNFTPYSNKLMICFGNASYDLSLDILDTINNRFGKTGPYYLAQKAECYYHLSDSVNFNKFKEQSIHKYDSIINTNQDLNDLLMYAMTVARLENEKEAIKLLETNKSLFEGQDVQMEAFIQQIKGLESVVE
jgi:hypothetical protein